MEKIRAALYEVRNFLKENQIIFESDDLLKKSKSTLPEQRTPDMILYPESKEEVQKIVKIANDLKIPLWYLSTGKNWGYGCKSANYDGGITLVLERMKKIELVDSDLCYAVIEPGVTYSDLNSFLLKSKYNLWTDSAGTTENASVIGNALDKGRGLTPYADHFGSLCGLEVVMPDGTFLSTSPSENFQSKHLYKWSIGPYVDGLFTQSNYGIVVSAGIWLMPKPDKFEFFAFEYTKTEKQFSQFIDNFRLLFFKNGLISRPHLANDFAMLCIIDKYPKALLTPNSKMLSVQALNQWKKKHGVTSWTFGGGLYGTSIQIKAQKQLVKKYLSPYGKIRFLGDIGSETVIGKIYRKIIMTAARLDKKSPEFIKQIFPAMNLFKGTPTDEFAKQVYFKSPLPNPTTAFEPALDDCGFIWTGPLVPFNSYHITNALAKAKQVFDDHQFDIFVELIVESPRNMIALFGVFYNPKDAEETSRANSWYKTIRKVMTAEGYLAYRELSTSTHLAMDLNPNLKRTLSKIKDALDENKIFAPGRYGIN